MKGILVFLVLLSAVTYGQSPNYNDSIITIKGTVVDTNFRVGFYNIVVLNKSTGKGVFGDYSGTFSIKMKKSDTIGVSVRGYETIYLSYADSAYKKTYNSKFYLRNIEVMGQEVIVRPVKSLKELKEERAAIEKRKVPEVTVSNAIQSPITALYVAFSKREKTKRFVAEMEYKDQQEEILREILRVYVHNDIFDLPDDEFDEFIRFLNIDPEYLKTASDYDLVTYIKARFEQFQAIKESGY